MEGTQIEKIKIDDILSYKFLAGIKHSPNGKHLCFVVHQMNYEENCYFSNLWIFSIKDENYYQLTSFNTEKAFMWVDNESIIFSDVRGEKDKHKKDLGEEFTQYYKINIHGGEARKFITIPMNVNSIKAIDSNAFIFTSTYDQNKNDLNIMDEHQKEQELKSRKEEKDYEVLDEIPFLSNGEGYTNKKRNRLYIYHDDSHEIRAITDEYSNVETFNLNEEKSKIVLTVTRFKEKMNLPNTIIIYDIAKSKISVISNPHDLTQSYVDFISRDTLIISGTDMKKYGLNEDDKFYIMSLESQNLTCITPDLDVSLSNSVGSDCRFGSSDLKQVQNGFLYFVTTNGDSSFLNRIDVTGKIEKITNYEGSVDGISIYKQNILFIGMKANKLQELFIQEDNVDRIITNFNQDIQDKRIITCPEKISVETQPGVIIDGWILKPVYFDESKKYPAILDIHGGPKTAYGTVFFHEMQYFASQGYVVFFCNPRGSDGKGNAFADIRGKYGTIDYEDIMKFTDEVIKRYSFIDAQNIGVTGGSYGGFMTNWIIGHTNRFKAAASQRSISNWVTEFCTTDIGYYFVQDQVGFSPWTNNEKLWDASPLKYADKVKTPTLFLHSQEDYRCSIGEGIQMFTALKFHGVEARLCMFRGENHELSRSGKPKHRLRRLTEIIQWFDKYLK